VLISDVVLLLILRTCSMNAKERRKLKREAERAAEPPALVPEPVSQAIKKEDAPSTAKVVAPTPAAGPEAMNAKARRMLKRAQEKPAETGDGAASGGKDGTRPSAAKTQSAAALDPASMEGLNAKERRMLKRAREREEQASAPVPKAGESGSGKKGAKRQRVEEPPAKHVPYVLFVGQLSYKTNAEMLRKHLEAGGVEGEIKVRLMTDKATHKSK
jgi:hypothetical protein